MIRILACAACCAALCLPAVSPVRAQEQAATIAPAAPSATAQERPATVVPSATGFKKAESSVNEGKNAPEEFTLATDIIKAGNDALQKGEDDSAYCLFDEGVMRLNALKGKYPEWQHDLVMKQIRNTLEVKDRLVTATCKNLEEMKEARFRFMVWQRQVTILRKLDLIQEQLDRMEKIQDKDDQYIKDIRDKIVR